eukprot:5221913-Pyramimonas_sp.AAC.1
MAHAAESAGRTQHWLSFATSGSSAWTAQEPLLVFLEPWVKEACFWYGFLADDFFSGAHDDFLTGSDVINYCDAETRSICYQ